VEKHERVASQMFQRNPHNIPGASEPCVGMSNPPLGLPAPIPQPLVSQCEALTAVVVFSVFNPNRIPILNDSAIPRHAVRNSGKNLRQV
jgi:hypothetical protein